MAWFHQNDARDLPQFLYPPVEHHQAGGKGQSTINLILEGMQGVLINEGEEAGDPAVGMLSNTITVEIIHS